jgi:hypothetical protein
MAVLIDRLGRTAARPAVFANCAFFKGLVCLAHIAVVLERGWFAAYLREKGRLDIASLP